MKVPIEIALHLHHQVGYGTLATHSTHLPGYPFATILPFVPDENHRPVFFISRLAEHTKNLLADPRASFLIAQPNGEDVQTGARVTVAGEVRPIDATDGLAARYLRYHPEAKQLLEFGDFAFFRLEPARLRLIAGFGQAGWVVEAAWKAIPSLSLLQESELLNTLDVQFADRLRVQGLDRYGIDMLLHGKRERLRFRDAPLVPGELEIAARRMLELCLLVNEQAEHAPSGKNLLHLE